MWTETVSKDEIGIFYECPILSNPSPVVLEQARAGGATGPFKLPCFEPVKFWHLGTKRDLKNYPYLPQFWVVGLCDKHFKDLHKLTGTGEYDWHEITENELAIYQVMLL